MAGQFMQICGMLNTVSNGVPVGANFTSVVLNHLQKRVLKPCPPEINDQKFRCQTPHCANKLTLETSE